MSSQKPAKNLDLIHNTEVQSDEQIEESKNVGDDIAESVSQFSKGLFASKPDVTKEVSTKGDEEPDPAAREVQQSGARFGEVHVKEMSEQQFEDFYSHQQNEMLGEHLVAERNQDVPSVPFVKREQDLNEEIAGKQVKVGK